MEADIKQATLISGFYRCQNCGSDVPSVSKVRRFRFCEGCYREVVEPTLPGVEITDQNSPVIEARMRYWERIRSIEARHPKSKAGNKPKKFAPPSIDPFWPFCRRCGAKTKERLFSSARSLFGRSRSAYCPMCEAKSGVEAVFKMASTIERDEEEWLDVLYKSHREAFDLGVLPDYWYELKIENQDTL